MNLRDFQYIVAVAELGHFGKAAEACHVSQPTLSGQIRKLEETLGVEIFERTKRSVRVTPEGSRIVARAQASLAEADAIREIAAAARNPLSGPLRLGVIPTIAPYLMPRLIPALVGALPEVSVKLTERFTRDLEAMLLAGELDAAVTASEPGAPRLRSIPLYEEPFWIALPGNHALAAREEIDLGELKGERLLLLSEGHCLRDQVLSFYPAIRSDPAAISTEETSLTTILALVGGGLGITLVPAMSLAGPWVTDAGIAVRREASGAARREVRLVFRGSFTRMALIDKLADVIAATVPDTVIPQRR
jgi:LysR family hydrogen peroxide-inducible transcriptional activator